jgi:hypothetical protein
VVAAAGLLGGVVMARRYFVGTEGGRELGLAGSSDGVDGVEMVRLPSTTTEVRIIGGEFSWAKVGGTHPSSLASAPLTTLCRLTLASPLPPFQDPLERASKSEAETAPTR